ncbi:glycosyltransferase family 4 protein [Alicyclobacillus dauci]|uniref:Glycosyltransferase family 4 protein n=1 Tax=Alicyclobacillus dauci TaxID=1475485 RepID=A0ABY6Z8P1_9BACL|nr:glycosyltransferase family 4 protein [Alicyclobacillus dauci]WAH39241.1 glycosyltransferase family 4 protein [Alicyclobacillus dauci]
MLVAPEGLPIPPSRGGSVQIYLSHLHESLSKRDDVRVTLVSPSPKSHASHGNTASSRHMTIPGDRNTYWSRVRTLIGELMPDVVQIDNRPSQALDIIHAHTTVPVILNMHSTTFLGPKHISSQRAREILQSTQAVVCNSEDLARTLRARCKLPLTWRYHVIYPGVEQGASNFPRRIRTRPHSPLRLLFVGRVIQQKGVHICIEVIRELQKEFPITLTVVGRTPPWEKAYGALVKQRSKHLNIHFTGFIEPSRLHDLYENHDILLCPSQKHEAFGLVNVEAMTHGIPVVASHIGGIPEAVGEDGGLLVRTYKQPRQFAQAVRILRDEQTYRKYSEAALKRSRHFTWAIAAQKFSKLYQEVRNNPKESSQ